MLRRLQRTFGYVGAVVGACMRKLTEDEPRQQQKDYCPAIGEPLSHAASLTVTYSFGNQRQGDRGTDAPYGGGVISRPEPLSEL